MGRRSIVFQGVGAYVDHSELKTNERFSLHG
jgi:hypothetical protein